MKNTKMFSADAAEVSAAPSILTRKSPKGYSPLSMADAVHVSEKVNACWAANPDIILAWTTQTDFDTLVTNLAALVEKQESSSSLSPSDSRTLKSMDEAMNSAVKSVKRGIDYKFQDAATAQYARYGIVKQGSTYQLPRDRNDRLLKLPLMIDAVAADGFGSETWGTAFWTDMLKRYTDAMKTNGDIKGDVSVGSGDINKIIRQINKTATSLRFVLRGNYPETYQNVYRSWGWQRETY